MPANRPRVVWYLVYQNPLDQEAKLLGHFRKGDRPCPRLHPSASFPPAPVRPPDGLNRPPFDARSRIAVRQRRPPLFWSLTLYFAVSDAQIRARCRATFHQCFGQWPRFPGPFSLPQTDGWELRICDKLASAAIGSKNHLHCGISYTRILKTLTPSSVSAHWGDGPCSPQGTAKRDVAEDGQCMHASLFLRIAIYHWPKGADAAPTGPSYNSSLELTAMGKPLQRDDHECMKRS
jgi:hypothetical protein